MQKIDILNFMNIKHEYPAKMPVLVMDIDGTVRYSASGETFVQGLDDIAVYDEAVTEMFKYKDAGYLIVGCSNQGGVAYEIGDLHARFFIRNGTQFVETILIASLTEKRICCVNRCNPTDFGQDINAFF